MSEMIEQLTTEQIQKHFSACMDSVNLIQAGKPEDMDAEEWADCLERNREHLRIMLAKDFWTTQDMSAIQAAAE